MQDLFSHLFAKHSILFGSSISSLNKKEKYMRNLKFLGIAALAGMLLTSCASVAHVEKDESVNFSKYKSFAWIDAKEEGETKKANTLLEKNVKSAVSAELQKQGWQESKNKPDVLLNYDVLVERAVKENTNPVYSRPFTRMFYNPYSRRWTQLYYPSQFMGYDRQALEVREGTITITMIDAKTDKTVWQGWTTDQVNSRNLTAKEVQSSVKSIFRKFDVANN
jgi:hypothetical protein